MEALRTGREQHMEFIQLQWPGGHLGDGEQVAAAPLLHQGDELFLCTHRTERGSLRGGRVFRTDAGDHAVNDEIPVPAIRTVNGLTAPIDPTMPQEMQDREIFRFPDRVFVYGQPWRDFIEFVRWGCTPENRAALKYNPMPGVEKTHLRRLPPRPADLELR